MSSVKPLLIPARKLDCADFGGSAGAFVEFEPEFCTRIAKGDVRFLKWDGTSWMMDQGDGVLAEITPDDILMTCDRDAPHSADLSQ